MQQDLQLRGEGNRVVTLLFGRVLEKSWSQIAAKPYAYDTTSLGPADAVPPRSALFVVGDMQHDYPSAVDDAAHAAWFVATDPGRETAICLQDPGRELPSTMPGVDDGGDLPSGVIDGIGEVRTPTYGTHGAITRLEISPASREPIPGTIWLPGWVWDPCRQMSDERRPGYAWTGEVTGITRYLTHHDLFVAPTNPPEGVESGQRWLTPHVPGSWLWWRLMAFSLRTPGHDVVCVEPDHSVYHHHNAAKMRPTAMAATARQWSWFGDAWRNEVDNLDLQHVVIVEGERSSATEQLLAQAFPRARVTYGFG